MNAITLSHHMPTEETRLRGIVQDILERAKAKGATEAEVEVGQQQGFSVSVRMGEVEHIEFNRDKSVDITVYKGKRTGSASTTDISDQALQDTVEAACRIASFTNEDNCAGLAEPQYLAKECPSLDLYYPWNITPQEAEKMAISCEARAMAFDKRITNSDGVDVYTSEGVFVYGNSHGFVGGYPSSRHGLNCVLVAEQAGEKERDYDYTSARDPRDLTATDNVGLRAAKRTIAKLGARKIKTQKAPVIFEAPVASSLLKYFLSAISGGNQYRKSSFLLDHVGKVVFPAQINIFEDPFLKKGFGSAPFDNDGVACSKKHFIENGVLTRYLVSTYSARKLGLSPTGNAGGVHNLQITHTDDDLASLLKKMDTGFLVTELMGNGISIVTGDYSQGASGFWVEKGVIQYPVSGVSIAGNLRDMFAGLVCVAGDIDRRRNVLTGSILLDELMVAGA